MQHMFWQFIYCHVTSIKCLVRAFFTGIFKSLVSAIPIVDSMTTILSCMTVLLHSLPTVLINRT